MSRVRVSFGGRRLREYRWHRMPGQHSQAEPLLTRVLAIKEKLLGFDHPDVALSVVNLAQLRVVQEQPEKTEPLYRRSLPTRERVLEQTIQGSRRRWRTLPTPCGNRACRRGDLAGAVCQKLSREAELNRQRHPV